MFVRLKCPRKEFLLRVSYMEIYNETVTDLLCDSWKRKPLEIREGNYVSLLSQDIWTCIYFHTSSIYSLFNPYLQHLNVYRYEV